jgi:hypothetical protein
MDFVCRTFVERDQDFESFQLSPEWIVSGIVQHSAVVRIGPEHDALEAELLDGAPRLDHRGSLSISSIHQRHDREREQPIRSLFAEVCDPRMVGAAQRAPCASALRFLPKDNPTDDT